MTRLTYYSIIIVHQTEAGWSFVLNYHTLCFRFDVLV